MIEAIDAIPIDFLQFGEQCLAVAALSLGQFLKRGGRN